PDLAMKNKISRKEFLALSALGGLGLMAGCATAAAATRRIPPDGKLRHACIGVRGMGGVDLPSFKSHPRLEIVALCDVDKNHLAEAAKEVPGARQYTDWRELLAKEAGNIDSVNIAVPDHMHAIIALAFIRAGKKCLLPETARARRRGMSRARAGGETGWRGDAARHTARLRHGRLAGRASAAAARPRQNQARGSVLQPAGRGSVSAARSAPRAGQSGAIGVGLEFMDWHRARTALRAGDLSSGAVALMAGFRHRLVGGHRLAHFFSGLERAGVPR